MARDRQVGKRAKVHMGYLSRPWKKNWGRAGVLIGLALSLVAAVATYLFEFAGSAEIAGFWFILIAGGTLAYSLVLIPISMFAIWTMSSDHLGN